MKIPLNLWTGLDSCLFKVFLFILDSIQLKAKVYQRLMEMVDDKIESLNNIIKSLEESRNSETKSSVGDKYETGRAMVQIEIDNNQIVLFKAIEQKNLLSKLENIATQYISNGSLVFTNKGNFYIGISLGKFKLDEVNYYAISSDSPIGKLLIGKGLNEQIQFNEIKYLIKGIC